MSSEQRTQVTQTFSRVNIREVQDVNFNISVGTRIPRTVTLVEVPEEIVRIVPAWRRYRVVKVRNQILIVEPDTLEIVEIIRISS